MKFYLAALGLAAVTNGMMASPKPYKVKVDGENCELNVKMVGNAFQHFEVTEDGFALCYRNGERYYINENGECSDVKLSCSKVVPKGIKPRVKPKKKMGDKLNNKLSDGGKQQIPKTDKKYTGPTQINKHHDFSNPTSSSIPSAWKCDASWYATNDGCDCNCGAIDPDCNSIDSYTTGEDIWCNLDYDYGGPLHSVCDNNCDLTNPPTPSSSIPSAWKCDVSWYATNDGCDCNCGAIDPDCNSIDSYTTGEDIWCNLDYDYGGPLHSVCDNNCPDVPEGWKCDASYYATNDGCDCNCGAIDPDCDVSDPPEYSSDDGVKCNYDFDYGGPVHPLCSDICEEKDPEVPDDWKCKAHWYGTNDGCDCNCGAIDPDCDLDDGTPLWCNLELSFSGGIHQKCSLSCAPKRDGSTQHPTTSPTPLSTRYPTTSLPTHYPTIPK